LFAGWGRKITAAEKYFSIAYCKRANAGVRCAPFANVREGYRGGKNVFNPVHITSKGTTAQTRRDAAAYGWLCVGEGCDTID